MNHHGTCLSWTSRQSGGSHRADCGGRLPALAAWVLAFLAVALFATTVRAENTRTQTLQLVEGWNAVFLEVYPADSDPAVVFANTPVDIAAALYDSGSSAQFMTDPGADLFHLGGWAVWYSDQRPDAFLKTLYAIYGQQAYLVHAKSSFAWQVTGAVVPPQIRWRPNSFNLVGFSVAAVGGPTFAQFFAGSAALRSQPIYRLTAGSWRKVTVPGAETIRSGEAFWIYCDGASDYQGPLSVKTATMQGVVLGLEPDDLTLWNETDHPITPTVEHVVTGSNPVPLAIAVQVVGDPTAPVKSVAVPKPDGAWTQLLPPLEARASIKVPFQARSADMQSAVQASVLKVSSDLGTEVWVPVFGIREDLK